MSAAKQRSTEFKAAAMKEYQAALYTQLQNKPYRYPPAVPDSETPIFGRFVSLRHIVIRQTLLEPVGFMDRIMKIGPNSKNVEYLHCWLFYRIDVNPDRVREMRKRAREVMNHQLKTVEDRKTAKKLEKQQGIQFEVGMLTRAKTE